jgi:hypothetical protein
MELDRLSNQAGVSPEALVLHWRQNPVVAAKDILNVKLDKHQQVVINTRWHSDRQIDVLSRGTGKTFINAVFAVLRAMLIPGHKVGLIAPSFRQSKMIFAEVEKLYQKSAMFQEACKKPPASAPDKSYVNFDAAPGMVGSVIEALPLGTDGAKIRGARYFDVIADEGAQIDEHTLDTVVQGFLATSADPMERVDFMEEQLAKVAAGIMREDQIQQPENNKFILTSTAFYQYNHLWRRVSTLIKDIMGEHKKLAREGGDLTRFKLRGGALNGGQIPHRLISDGKRSLCAFSYTDPSAFFMNTDTIEQAKKEMTDYTFRMEYECFFPPDSEGFFNRMALDRCRTHAEFSCMDAPRKGMTYTMGIDPARNNDNFAISIWEIDPAGGTVNLVRVLAFNKKSFPHMHQVVRQLRKKYEITYFEMDAGGGGTSIRDLLADKLSCPIGEKLILEQDLDEHRPLIGDRFLGPLVQFSNYEWVHGTNHALLSAVQHGRVKIASKPGCGGEVWTPMKDEMDQELEEALTEMSSIVMSASGDRMRWDTPTDTQRKDRYSAILVGFSAAMKLLGRSHRGTSPVGGGWA